ncbi:uncharacterized protein LOC106168565 [Lingula anatina]|uniref:Uncharacterized protein LOC106168565 n=1 Tax=Lingula anatina TaxID=7574 RepID=A0A1S3IYS5_LINAN|nr:uncharacterized protein LOC106168565 [Lingula anatina]|eukprot:XP_013403136.1 uncharacterized protein LOC106168565 [Lingula anatina]
MKQFKAQFIFSWVLCISCFITRAVDCQKWFSEKNVTRFTSILEERVRRLMKCGDIPGLSIAVVKGNTTVLLKGLGYGDEKRQTFVNEESLFCIASLTKAFTSTLIASLLGDNAKNVTWDTPIRAILGHHFSLEDVNSSETASLRDLLAHRMGLPRFDLARFSTSFRKEFYKRLKFLHPSAPLRHRFIYNNWMYFLAARVSEKLGGKPWEELLQQRIFDPLKMSSTTFTSKLHTNSVRFVHALIRTTETVANVDPLLHRKFSLDGADSICSTAADMVKWLKFHVSAGKSLDDHQLINSELLQDTHTQQISQQLLPKVRQNDQFTQMVEDGYGLGWGTGNYRGDPVLTHSGDLFGYTSKLTILPQYKLGIFTNSNGPAGSGVSEVAHKLLHSLLADAVLGFPKQINEREACIVLQSQQKQSSLQQHEWKRQSLQSSQLLFEQSKPFTGVYVHSGLGIINISYTPEKTLLRLTYDNVSSYICPSEIVDRFLMEPTGVLKTIYGVEPVYRHLSYIEFIRKFNGGVLGVAIPLFDWENPPIFVKHVEGQTPSDTLAAEYQIYIREFKKSFSTSKASCNSSFTIIFYLLTLTIYEFS